MGKTNAKKRVYKGITFRSGLEVEVAKTLTKLKIKWSYEKVRLDYPQKVTHRKVRCLKCGGKDIIEDKGYTPDFLLKLSGKFLEVKGRFTMSDRKKMINVLKSNPKIDLVMVFQEPRIKLSKKSKKSYGDWCDEKGVNWIGYKDLITYLK